MNILLINHYAGSPKMGMEYRPFYLAKEWMKLGHKVTILVATYSHLRQKTPKIQKDFTTQDVDGINYVWVKTPNYEGNGVSRVRNIFSFVFKIYKKAKYLSETIKPDVVIASSTYPSDNYVARRIAHLSKAKYIYEVHDLWPLSPKELGNISKYHPFIMLMQHGENYAYKNADSVISMLPNTKEHMSNHGLDLDKWYHVPNGIYISEVNNPEELDTDLADNLNRLKSKIIIGYAGGHAISNSLDTIVEAARILKDDDKYAFVLVGSGNEKNNLIKQAKGLPNIHFFNSIPKKQIPSLLSKMDYLLIAWNKEKLYRFGISPNKIFDYMMASKPIIHAVEAPNTFVKEAKCGIHVEPENPQAIVDAIKQLTEMSANELSKMGQSGKKFVLENHDYKVLAKQMCDIFIK